MILQKFFVLRSINEVENILYLCCVWFRIISKNCKYFILLHNTHTVQYFYFTTLIFTRAKLWSGVYCSCSQWQFAQSISYVTVSSIRSDFHWSSFHWIVATFPVNPRQSRWITRSNVAILSIQIGTVTISIPPRTVPPNRTVACSRVIIANFRGEWLTVVIKWFHVVQVITYPNTI